MSTNFAPSTFHTSQKLQQYAVRDKIILKYNETQYFNTHVEQSINTFKNDFFWSSQSETINAAKFEDSGSSEKEAQETNEYYYLENL